MLGLLFDLSDLLSPQSHPWTIKLTSIPNCFDYVTCCLLLQTLNFVITFLEDALQVKTMSTNLLPLNLTSVHGSEYVLFSDTCSCICLPMLRSAYVISIGWQEQDISWNVSGSVPAMPHSSPFSTLRIVDASKPIIFAVAGLCGESYV
jgi:hypothetical protein